MLAKAIVVKIIDEHNVKVRIPVFDKIQGSAFAAADEDLRIACICCPPGVKFALRTGDIVFVDFELDNLTKPVIMGMLSRDNMLSSCDIEAQSLDVVVNAELPQDVKIRDNELNKIQLQDYLSSLSDKQLEDS